MARHSVIENPQKAGYDIPAFVKRPHEYDAAKLRSEKELFPRMDYTHHYSSPLGGITMASDGSALTGLWFDGQKFFGDTLSEVHEERALPVFEETDRWLDIYFSGQAPDFTPELKLRATAFRKAVWQALLAIPYGQTITYGAIAARIAEAMGTARMSARAVGGAVGHNSISLIIPCHRVVGANGKLTGYTGGTEKKKRLLEMEKNARTQKGGILT